MQQSMDKLKNLGERSVKYRGAVNEDRGSGESEHRSFSGQDQQPSGSGVHIQDKDPGKVNEPSSIPQNLNMDSMLQVTLDEQSP